MREAEELLAGSDDRPAVILISGWSAWSDTCLDFATTNALWTATMERCAKDGVYMVDQAVARKLVSREAEGLEFIPLAVGTFGGWYPHARQVISHLGCKFSQATGNEYGVMVCHLRQRLCVLLVHDNVSMLRFCISSFAL